ncbi:MAG: chorismate mutase [Spirochaetaceae bacterium]|nr:chorismate mutase [Spirochaetaceae bacterium]
MSSRLFGIRGAVCCGNTVDEIQNAVEMMCSSLFSANEINAEDIVSIQFTITPDLDAMNPAAALRKSKCGSIVKNSALFCSQEPVVKGSLPKTIRVLLTAYMQKNRIPVHCYTGGAEVLRPDFTLKAKEL